jgi:hypothetical protein
VVETNVSCVLENANFSVDNLSSMQSVVTTILRNRSSHLIPIKKEYTMKFSSLAIAGAVLASASVHGFSTPASFGVRQHTQLSMATAIDADTKTALATAANESRGIAMDSIAAAKSGHMGLPLGAAEIGAVLYGSQVRFSIPFFPSAIYTFE